MSHVPLFEKLSEVTMSCLFQPRQMHVMKDEDRNNYLILSTQSNKNNNYNTIVSRHCDCMGWN